MPIAKLVSSDGPIDIYYELHGAVQTGSDDDVSTTKVPSSSSLEQASAVDAGLRVVKRAVDEASAADAAADAGRIDIEEGRLLHTNGGSSQLCPNVLFICGMSARGRTEFFQPIVSYLSALPGPDGRPLLTCCTYDNRGIGNSSIPPRYAAYRTRHMAADAVALMGHLGWERAHVLGMSLGGMVGCRLLAAAPHRVASLTMLSTTLTGCNMATTMLRRPWITLRAGQGPLRSRIPANLRANFSPHYLAQRVGDKTRKQLLTESTWEAIRLGLTEKFLAEAQPAVGKNGHVLAVLTHRLSKAEVAAMRAAHVPLQMINGRHDVVAGLGHVQRLARALACPLVLTEGAHAGICLETPGPINAAMERIIGVAPPSLRLRGAAAAVPNGVQGGV